MCTVTFIARQKGYALGMNRDEQLSRIRGVPPSKKVINGCDILAPSEPGGGTWIALNDGGVACAIINWYAITARVNGAAVSRGRVVDAVCTAKSPASAGTALARLPLGQINPFRLIGIFPVTKEIVEWRWDLKRLIRRRRSWKDRQWISSGFDEPAAQRVRGRTFREALKRKSAGSLGWLRRLHRSHAPQCGAFSTCMHRTDAVTVSYTEIVLASRRAVMRHVQGAPCQAGRKISNAKALRCKGAKISKGPGLESLAYRLP